MWKHGSMYIKDQITTCDKLFKNIVKNIDYKFSFRIRNFGFQAEADKYTYQLMWS